MTTEIARRVAPGKVGRARSFRAAPRRRPPRGRRGRLADVVECKVGDARALPFADGVFDRAFCHWVLLHVSPPEGIVREMRRVVRRGGRVICVEMDWETPIVFPGMPRGDAAHLRFLQ